MSFDIALRNPGSGFNIALSSGAATQEITGASFTNTQTFGSGTISQPAANQDITGASFTNTSTFGTGVITSTYEITGVSFSNTNDFGSGAITQVSPQEITGASFTNLNSFGSGVVTGGASTEDLDAVLPLFDRRTLKKLRRKFRELTKYEEDEKRLRAKIRKSFKPETEEIPVTEADKVPDVPEVLSKPSNLIQLPQIDYSLFNEVLSNLEAKALNIQKIRLMQALDRKKAIAEYEALVLQQFENEYRARLRREKDQKELEFILTHILTD